MPGNNPSEYGVSVNIQGGQTPDGLLLDVVRLSVSIYPLSNTGAPKFKDAPYPAIWNRIANTLVPANAGQLWLPAFDSPIRQCVSKLGRNLTERDVSCFVNFDAHNLQGRASFEGLSAHGACKGFVRIIDSNSGIVNAPSHAVLRLSDGRICDARVYTMSIKAGVKTLAFTAVLRR